MPPAVTPPLTASMTADKPTVHCRWTMSARGAGSRRARQPRPEKRRGAWRRLARRTAVGLAVAAGILVALWTAVHRVRWLGPWCADALRGVLGPAAVARIEDAAYGLQDRFDRLWRSEELPKAYWTVPAPAAPPATAQSSKADGCTVPPLALADVGPVHERFSAPGDGQWVAITDPWTPNEPPIMHKTLLHPDRRRSWAAVSIVAIDLRRARLHLLAGSREPQAETREARGMKRPARIPQEDRANLLAAFNGGFKTEHGHWGMKLGDTLIVPPRPGACWVAALPHDELLVGRYDEQKVRETETLWWRQTPACMVVGGELHPGLRSERNTYWGATLSGETVIRRSAIGLGRGGKVLFSAIGDHTTARALALALQHAGANAVAQLDVNWAYPRFVLYHPRTAGSKELVATKLCEGFDIADDEYLGTPAPRDFFYLTRTPTAEVAHAVCDRDEPAHSTAKRAPAPTAAGG